jgi:isoleucyl-tRNA synthetase
MIYIYIYIYMYTYSHVHETTQIVLDVLLAAVAPIMPHMAEDAWLNLPYEKPAKSVFQHGWNQVTSQAPLAISCS